MSTAVISTPTSSRPPAGLDSSIEIVIPVYNEARELAASVTRLRGYLDANVPFRTVVTIVDNASTDDTWDIAERLAQELAGVDAYHLDRKGRGRALKAAWSKSTATVVAYMDVDLSTDLGALLPLVAPLLSGHSDLAIGTRLAKGSHVVRGPKREVISRCYNLLVRAFLHNRFSDAQCGFKALRTDVARDLLPSVEDDQWFFDTELLVQAERLGFRIHEVPVDWVDDADSRVDILQTALDDMRGIWRMVWHRADPGQSRPAVEEARAESLRRFVSVGVVSTLAYVVLYLLLRNSWGEYLANATSLAVCTLGNVVAHRRITFGHQRVLARRVIVVGTAVVFGTSLVLTSGALALVNAIAPPSALTEILALGAGSGLAACWRFVLLRSWMFKEHARTASQSFDVVGGGQ